MEISREYSCKDKQFLFLIQDSFLTQHAIEPTRGENVLDVVLSSQNELVDNVKIYESKKVTMIKYILTSK